MILGLDVRGAHLRTLDLAREVLAAPEVTTAWDDASVLAELSVRGLAGHLTRAGTLVEHYLDAAVPETIVAVADATEYYLVAAVSSDVGDAINTGIRERAEAEGAVGPAALVEQFDSPVARRRHGDLAVLRALTRRERDTIEALRAF